MQEEWKAIENFEGLYEVSNQGRIKSLERTVPKNNNKLETKLLTTKPAANTGYPKVSVTNGKVRKTFNVHSLVAKAFIPNPQGLKYINHKDGNKLNNHFTNLEWVTQSSNINHAFRTGLSRSGEAHEWSKLSEDDVRAIRASTGPASKEAVKYKVSKTAILRVRNFQTWKYLK